MNKILGLLIAATFSLTSNASDRPLGKLANGTYYLLDEVDFALKPDAAQRLSPTGPSRRQVDKTSLRGLHSGIRDVVGGHESATAWLDGKPLPKRVRPTGGEVPLTARVLKAKLAKGQDPLQVVDLLRKHPDVEGAGLSIIHRISHVPDDTFWSSQWAPVRVAADQAWDVPQASTHVRVAIVDTGVDKTHPDLASRIVYSAGYSGNPDGDAKRDMRGGNSIDHGTHVAGIAAAIRDNQIGIAGIATADIMAMGCATWNSDLGEYGIGSAGDAILDAVDNGADVVNCSFGMSWWNFDGVQSFWTPRLAVYHAQNNGVVVVCAAGNDSTDVASSASAGWDRSVWPLIVSSTGSDVLNSLSSFSNFGNAIDLAAPGEQILSTVTTNFGSALPNGNYRRMSGTSMASPCVAGAAAMVKGMNPGRIPGDGVKNLLYRMALDLGATGKDPVYGYGLLQLRPEILRGIKEATAFVGPNTDSHDGNYSRPYTSISEAIGHTGAGATLVLNAGLSSQTEYHYAAQTLSTPVTLMALPDRPVIIGQ